MSKELNHFGAIAASFQDRLGTGDTDRWRINTCDVSVPGAPYRKNAAIAPKWFNSLDTNFSFSREIVLKVIANTELSVLQLSNMACKTRT